MHLILGDNISFVEIKSNGILENIHWVSYHNLQSEVLTGLSVFIYSVFTFLGVFQQFHCHTFPTSLRLA